MKKLKVTWLSGAWGVESMETASVDLPENANPEALDGDVIAFKAYVSADDGEKYKRTFLVVPAARLISAVFVDEGESPNGPPVDSDDLTLWNVALDLRQGHREPLTAEQVAGALIAWGNKKGLA